MNEEVVETYQRKFVISKDVLKEGKAGLGAERTPVIWAPQRLEWEHSVWGQSGPYSKIWFRLVYIVRPYPKNSK